jgi:hypothetical protein
MPNARPELLPQEVQERLVEGRRILVTHEVRGLGNDHQATAGNALHDDLIDQHKVSRTSGSAADAVGSQLHAFYRYRVLLSVILFTPGR